MPMTSSDPSEVNQLKSTIQQLEERSAQLSHKLDEVEAARSRYQEQLEQEMSAHKKVEETIERGKREWEATFDAVKDMVILTDANGKIIRSNFSTCRYLEKKYNELLGCSIEELFFVCW